MKKNTILCLILFSSLGYSQVGINTEVPVVTLDVTGKPTDISKLDGLAAPRITRAQLGAKITQQRKMAL